jgi:formylglycine-generating enzyme required for sulfatase activity
MTKPDEWNQLLGRLQQAEIETDPLQLAEIAWLSLLLQAPEPSAAAPPSSEAKTAALSGPGASPLDLSQKPAEAETPLATAGERENDPLVYANETTPGGKVPASRVRVPGVPALPEAEEINRALRPLLRRNRSRRFTEIDEDTTVSLSADAGCTLPVFRGLPERAYDAALVVEQKPTMAAWRETVREFQLLLERHGAFGDVRRFDLAIPEDESFQARLISNSGAELSLASLNDPLGKRIVFLITDGVSEAWTRGRMAQLARDWIERAPVVVVQTLSPHLWRLTSLGRPKAKAVAPRPGAPNVSLTVFPPPRMEDAQERLKRKELLPLPIVTLDPRRLAPWAAMLAGGSSSAETFLLSPLAEKPARQSGLGPTLSPDDGSSRTAEELVERFEGLVSPAAFRLAGFFSLVPLHLPVMLMVQRLMLPESRIEHLSEVLLGGLVRRAEIPELPLEEGEVAFEFLDERIRDLLIEPQVRKSETLRVLDELSGFVEREYGVTCDFKALVVNEKGDLQVDEKALPFARIADRALGKFGLMPRRKTAAAEPSDPEAETRELDDLIATLAGEDAGTAVETLVRRRDGKTHERLFQALDDPTLTQGVARVLAAQAIGGDERALSALQQAATYRPAPVRESIFRAVKSFPQPESLDLLRPLVDSYFNLGDPYESFESYQKLIETLEIPGWQWAAELLVTLVTKAEDGPQYQIVAAQALGRMGVASIMPDLVPILLRSMAHRDLRLAVIRAYAEIGGGLSALQDLRRTLFYDQSERQYQRILPDIDQVLRELEFGEQGLLVHDFTVVKLNEAGEEVQRYERSAGYFEDDLSGGVTIKMVAIPGGEFLMGSVPEEERSYDDERPQHRVSVPSFFMGMHPVTLAQWLAVAQMDRIERDLKPEPSRFKGDDRPVEQVSWEDAQEFCRRLSRATGKAYRLPSEAEWEYACRAGTTTPFHFGPTITPEHANYDGNYPYGSGPKGVYREETTPVGHFKIANDFGLYDMHGNVWEWCEDGWHDNYDSPDRPDDGSSWQSRKETKPEGLIQRAIKSVRSKPDNDDIKDHHVLRGGSWIGSSSDCRSAYRDYNRFVDIYYFIGFRVVVSSRKL